MSIEHFFLILIAGIGAGFINSMAGGGSLLTLPVLIFLGLPTAVANGTNRIALVFQNLAGIFTFRRGGFFHWKLGLFLSIPAVCGSIVGANLAVTIPDELFKKLLAAILFIVVAFVIWQPEKRISQSRKEMSRRKKIFAFVLFFFVGLYGGFIQVGIGFVIIAGLRFLYGMSLVEVNALKLMIALVYLFASAAVFFYHGKVSFTLGLTLALGNSLGAWAGSRFAIFAGDRWIRVVLIIAVLLMGGKLLGLF